MTICYLCGKQVHRYDRREFREIVPFPVDTISFHTTCLSRAVIQAQTPERPKPGDHNNQSIKR